MLRSARRREALLRQQREERGGAYCVAMCTACLFRVTASVIPNSIKVEEVM